MFLEAVLVLIRPCIQSFRVAMAMQDTDEVEFALVHPTSRVIAKPWLDQRPREGPTKGRDYSLLWTVHLAMKTCYAAAVPLRLARRVLVNIPCWTILHAESACCALCLIYLEHPAVDMIHQPSAR